MRKLNNINNIKALLEGLRVKIDDRSEVSPGFKFNEWELKGVPIRIEIGPKDLEKNSVIVARRDEADSKVETPIDELNLTINNLLKEIQENMFNESSNFLKNNTSHAEDMDQLITKLNESEGFVSCYWSENKNDELKIKELTKATIRCYPLDNNDEKQSINKDNEQGKFAIFSKSY